MYVHTYTNTHMTHVGLHNVVHNTVLRNVMAQAGCNWWSSEVVIHPCGEKPGINDKTKAVRYLRWRLQVFHMIDKRRRLKIPLFVLF